MERNQTNYFIFPCVLRVGRKTVVSIIPRSPHARLNDKLTLGNFYSKQNASYGEEYRDVIDTDIKYIVRVVPVDETQYGFSADERDYYFVEHSVNPDGSISFEYTCDKEQEYTVQLLNSDIKRSLTFSIYALESDLCGMLPYKGDLHLHSYYSDGAEAPEFVASNYRRAGYDFMALTDHYKQFPSLLLIDYFKDIDMNLKLFPGEEVHEPNHKDLHMISIGASISINEYFQQNREKCQSEVDAIIASLPASLPHYSRISVAYRIWASEKIRETGGLSVLVHPYWINGEANNMREDVVEYCFANNVCDAFEVVGGVDQFRNNQQIEQYNRQRELGRKIPIVGSCDAHGTEPMRFFSHAATIAFAPECTLTGIVDAIKDFRTVAYEKYPGDEFPRVHGPYRMVKYALFLLRNYYIYHDVFCYVEGTMMRELIQHEPDAEKILALYSRRLRDFNSRFFAFLGE